MGSSNTSRRWPALPGLGQEACTRETALWGHYPPGELCRGQGIWKAGLSQAEKGSGWEGGRAQIMQGLGSHTVESRPTQA